MVRSFFKPAAPPVARGLQTAPFRRRRHTIAEGCDDVSRMWAQGSMQTLAMETLVAAASLRDTPTTRGQRSRRALQQRIAADPLGPSLRSGPDRGLLNPMLDERLQGQSAGGLRSLRNVGSSRVAAREMASSAKGLARSPSGYLASAVVVGNSDDGIVVVVGNSDDGIFVVVGTSDDGIFVP